MFILKNKKGGVVDKTSYDEEKGNIYYNNKKVGTFELNHDSNLGSYYLYIMNDGREFHDHYFEDKDIIKACNL